MNVVASTQKRVEVALIDDNQEIVLSNVYYGVRAVCIADLKTRAESWCYGTFIMIL